MSELQEIARRFDQLVGRAGPDRERRLRELADPELRRLLGQLLEANDRAAATGFLSGPRD